MKDELFLSLPHGILQSSCSREALYALFLERANRFCMGDADSLPMKTAERLVGGILYAVDYCLRCDPKAQSLSLPVQRERGCFLLRRAVSRGKLLLRQADAHAPRIQNTAYLETVSSIRDSFRQYDINFFPQEVSASIDYQLVTPVSEALLGIEYINEYLRRLCMENEFLARFSEAEVWSLLLAHCNYDAELVINLIQPVLDAVVGAALLKRAPRPLFLTDAERAALLRLLLPRAEAERLFLLEEAASKALSDLGIEGESARLYLGRAMLELLPRLNVALAEGDLSGIFPPAP